MNSSDSVLDNISQPDDFIQDSTKIDEIGIGKDILVIKLRKECVVLQKDWILKERPQLEIGFIRLKMRRIEVVMSSRSNRA